MFSCCFLRRECAPQGDPVSREPEQDDGAHKPGGLLACKNPSASPLDQQAAVKAGCGLHDESGPLARSAGGVGIATPGDDAAGTQAGSGPLELLRQGSCTHSMMATASALELQLGSTPAMHGSSADDMPAGSPLLLSTKGGTCCNSSPLLHAQAATHIQGATGLHSISAISSVASSVDSITLARAGAGVGGGATQPLLRLLHQSCSALTTTMGDHADPPSISTPSISLDPLTTAACTPSCTFCDPVDSANSTRSTPAGPQLQALNEFKHLQANRPSGPSQSGLFALSTLSRSNSPKLETEMPSMRTIMTAAPGTDFAELHQAQKAAAAAAAASATAPTAASSSSSSSSTTTTTTNNNKHAAPLVEQAEQVQFKPLQSQHTQVQQPFKAAAPLAAHVAQQQQLHLQLLQPLQMKPALSRSLSPQKSSHLTPQQPLASEDSSSYRRTGSGTVCGSSGGALMQLPLSGCSSPQGSNARSADLVISEPETADAYQDNVLLSMLYSNAILIGGDDTGGGSDTLLPRLSPTHSHSRRDLPLVAGPVDDSSDGVLVPFSLLDPDSAEGSTLQPISMRSLPAVHTPQEQEDNGMPCWPMQQEQQQQSNSVMAELQSLTFTSASAPRLMAVSIGGRLIDVPSVSLDAQSSRSLPSLAGSSRSAAAAGGPSSRWVQSVPLPNSCQGGYGGKQESRGAGTSAPLLGGSGRASRFGRQTVCGPLGSLLSSTQDLNSIAEEEEEDSPRSLDDDTSSRCQLSPQSTAKM